MKHDTSGLDLDDLARHLRRAYHRPIVSLEFVPKGEDSFGYVATTASGERYFVRAKPPERGAEAEEIYEAVAALHERLGIAAAMAPLRSTQGTFSWEYRGHVVTVYPFVEGDSVYESGTASGHVAEVAGIMATLHRSDRTILPPLPAERFDNPFEPVIRGALTDATSTRPTSPYGRRVAELLVREQADVRATLDHMRRMQRAIVEMDPPFVVTHGDPNWANVLVGPQGSLVLTDWGELAIGPRERDLMHFTGEYFEAFLAAYLAQSGPIRLHRLLFAFYLYRWAMQEIADYTTRIMRPETAPEAAEHAWEELQPYLPVPHVDIGDGLAAGMAALGRQPSRFRLQLDDRTI